MLNISTPNSLRLPAMLSVLVYAALVTPTALFAHAGEKHDSPGVSTETTAQNLGTAESNVLPADFATIGGPFSLINHHGQQVTDKTYAGNHMLVFFGYSSCQIMCSISLKRIGDALTILQDDPEAPLSRLSPLVITVDPTNDTPARLRKTLSSYHPSLIGLTGTLEQLKPVYKAYRQKPSVLDEKLNDNTIISHTSYFYLMDQNGKLQTFFPPILSAESMANVIKKYLSI